MKKVLICDANILIDYAQANKRIIHLATQNLYEIRVPLPVWAEVNDLTDQEAKALGIKLAEPTLAQIIEVGQMYGGQLSEEDNICFVMARDEKAICATNEKTLRKKCKKNGIEIMWGLEWMIELCQIKKLSVDSAEKVARQIAGNNHTITDDIIARFLLQIKK
ncbi:MAG: hypothetical protein KKD05_05560 [Candidatus Omnitrophica bacterium]|nr:hypothetical protein [Candidatus Omnitrophota bacterium]